ncbi:MAG TPA: bifunctional pyr operon transcriptional regulator/uracil phosphoribosyltransferase PyrR [Candidatus Gallimonas intestinigallinarum]|uniref:Bifunctional protein PyrR n=1 Tax=Candidatus Gallimonas intestinigallinarum TaxID=2838604 RepID=A0A9D2IVT1_9FIRM|nr:bifunctional pyr operon transcriptional regulator/uracil phosphoribosyltransferase PyrR [Candidatus Gallimonas intestinigallinarum]
MQILTGDEMRRAVTRLAMQAVESCKGTDFVLIGIRTRGVILARRMQREIARLEGVEVPLGILDISLYRDDLLDGCDAVFKGSEIDFNLDGRTVVLCDDVLYTGRTVRAALSALASMGRARAVRLFTLIDRGHRELPFRADGVGKSVPTSRRERVVVHFTETDGTDSVELYKAGE